MEIEVKLSYKDKPKIVEKLMTWGFELVRISEVEDIYFSIGDETMSNKNKLFRIRSVDGKTELTMKDNLVDNSGIWSRREINVGIDSPEGARTILESLGCEFIKENKSKREVWGKGGISFEFISFTVPAVLDLVEIEAANNESTDQIVTDLGELVSKVGEEYFSVFDKKKA